MSTTDLLEMKPRTKVAEAEALVREILNQTRRAPEPGAGWILRKERTSPLETRHVAP
jgi:hypothetical protein